jgi:hypothetical protein
MQFLINFFLRLRGPTKRSLARQLRQLQNELTAAREAIGRIEMRQTEQARDLASAEFRVFSQFGEDGIIQRILRSVGPTPQTFVEFGVQDYEEANTRFLLVQQNWAGLVIDGSTENMKRLRSREIYWQRSLKAVEAFITRENINELIAGAGFTGEIGLLSIDIDGNDYWVWEQIKCVSPVVVVCEYNSLFGSQAAVTTPYDPAFRREKAHYSNLYFGASLAALASLGRTKGYELVGCNSAGNNAFFVRRDRLGSDLPARSPADAYVAARFRESRSPSGALTFLDRSAAFALIADLPVFDLVRQKMTSLAESQNGAD